MLHCIQHYMVLAVIRHFYNNYQSLKDRFVVAKYLFLCFIKHIKKLHTVPTKFQMCFIHQDPLYSLKKNIYLHKLKNKPVYPPCV